MVEINENTTIEKVEEPNEYKMISRVEQRLQDDLKAFESRLNSMMDKNQELQDKISVVNKEEMTLVIPKSFIKDAINEQISKRSDELLTRLEASEEILAELELEENAEVLESLTNLKGFIDRLDDVEYKLDDKIEQSDLYDYKEEYEIDTMINDALEVNNEELKDKVDDLKSKLAVADKHQEYAFDQCTLVIDELKSKVDELIANNNTMMRKVFKWLKGLFTPQK